MVEKIDKLDTQQVVNLPSERSHIHIKKFDNPKNLVVPPDTWNNNAEDIEWKSYQIKETDFRIKTASFVTPQYFDLSAGQWGVLISSPYHENFSGLILTNEYDAEKGLYTYKCQDWSRELQSKIDMVFNGTVSTYNIIRHLITHGYCGVPNPTQKQLETYKNALSGLRSEASYNDKDWGGATNINPMSQKPKMIFRNTSFIEAIRSLLLTYNIDVYFNDCGVLQVQPYHVNHFRNDGIELKRIETVNRSYKFDLTNIITGVIVENSDKKLGGTSYYNDTLVDLYGYYRGSISASEVPKTTSTSSTSTNKSNNGNPYGSKAKKIWINADNGSGSMKSAVASRLQNKGWSVHVGRTGSNVHYEDYYNVTSDYQVYATLYNGFCAGTVREAYSSRIQNVLKNKGVQLVIMWDTSDWTNPQGMKPYRYGDFTGYNAGRAWDDNFSSSDPSIKNVASWLKSNNAKYCAAPTADGIVEQFLAGGYFAYSGK